MDEALDFYVQNYEQNTTARYEAAVEKEGLTKVTFTPEQIAELDELAETVRQNWVKDHADQFDAQTLFEFTAQQFAEN